MTAFKPPKSFDVWFVTANTVYKAVPYSVVADWTQQGRLSTNDRLRPAGTESAWKAVNEWSFFVDYLPRAAITPVAASPGETAAAPISLPDAPEEETLIGSRKPGEDDDDVDMIPLIDISMVLLVFFIMVSAAGALSPVDVPEMIYGGELHSDTYPYGPAPPHSAAGRNADAPAPPEETIISTHFAAALI